MMVSLSKDTNLRCRPLGDGGDALMRKLGWQAQTSLRDGIAKAYADFLTKVTE